jgi:hypothetical protein
MKKLVLNPDQLRVQSFAALDLPAGTPGTVQAREATVTCLYPRCGTVVQRESCYDGCTYDNC